MVGMVLAGDRDRERAARSLRRHYLQGRLSADEFGERVARALQAREQESLRALFADLPAPWRDGEELRRVGRLARRGATLAVLTGIWLLVSVALLFVFLVAAIVHGLSATDALVPLLLWIALSAFVWRLARRA